MLNIFIYTFEGKTLIKPKYRTKKPVEAKVKEDTMTTNMEMSSMVTRSRRKITRFNQEESISTECDEKFMQTKTQQVRVSRGKDKFSRKHDASPYAKMTTCGKNENKTSVTPEKHTNETESVVDLYSPQQLLIGNDFFVLFCFSFFLVFFCLQLLLFKSLF